ncbi:unnamed protein product, partial [Amoebophrya sp. A120]
HKLPITCVKLVDFEGCASGGAAASGSSLLVTGGKDRCVKVWSVAATGNSSENSTSAAHIKHRDYSASSAITARPAEEQLFTIERSSLKAEVVALDVLVQPTDEFLTTENLIHIAVVTADKQVSLFHRSSGVATGGKLDHPVLKQIQQQLWAGTSGGSFGSSASPTKTHQQNSINTPLMSARGSAATASSGRGTTTTGNLNRQSAALDQVMPVVCFVKGTSPLSTDLLLVSVTHCDSSHSSV